MMPLPVLTAANNQAMVQLQHDPKYVAIETSISNIRIQLLTAYIALLEVNRSNTLKINEISILPISNGALNMLKKMLAHSQPIHELLSKQVNLEVKLSQPNRSIESAFLNRYIELFHYSIQSLSQLNKEERFSPGRIGASWEVLEGIADMELIKAAEKGGDIPLLKEIQSVYRQMLKRTMDSLPVAEEMASMPEIHPHVWAMQLKTKEIIDSYDYASLAKAPPSYLDRRIQMQTPFPF